MMTRWKALALPSALLLATPVVAQVEEGLIVQPAIPQNFGRDRNVSVQQQSRPDYDPLGIPLGSLNFFPGIEIGGGGDSNTYLTAKNRIASAYLYQEASARLISGWSRHSLQITGSTTQREYIGQSQRNEDLWTIDADGRLDIYDSLQVEGDANISRGFENIFSGEVTPTVAALSRYRRNFGSIKTTYTQGRIRTFLLLDHADFNFAPVPLRAGGEQSQSERNRQITRLTGQIEYARTPSVSFFAQLGGSRTSFSQDLPSGLPNVDSKAVRFLGGVNVDIAQGIRGTVGLGYSIRNYDASAYKTVRGLSIETQLQAFPTSRLTFGLTAQRTIEDATIGGYDPFRDTALSVTADYEVLRNLIISAAGYYSRQSFLVEHTTSNVYGASASARFLVSRRISLRGILNYGSSPSNSVSHTTIEVAAGYQL
ncbi:outer membrane beta-barrel protein [Sphingomonas abietis]|uniref:Outer membrane beta-barrel protein n=1 Tax=Sphingomonas abietis TaxID=3012344 RepID=A0ABY7NJS0_9SPHN|nr:outer membrane beta-barrel protein [Sphingomonas abietis]WBO20842.1 outer membrane beta-barrel protein [Sphingomonas abietis]